MITRGCLTCRRRHLKCDKSGDVCLRCQRSGRQCIPAPVKPEEVTFRHGQNPSLRPRGPPRYGETDLSFPDDQVWLDTPCQVVAFEDETDRTAADYQVVPTIAASSLYLKEPSDNRSATFRSTLLPSPSSLPSPALSPGVLSSPHFPFDTPPNITNSLLPASTMVHHHKLSNFNEAFLLRHFRNTIGAWLDINDHEKYFSLEVTERSTSCSLLLYACLATAARHLSQTNNSVPLSTADHYHERCIEILLPAVESPNFQISIEVLLASTVVLRLFEQISSRTPLNDSQRHLLAGSVYIGSHVDCAISGGLAEASFWAFVLQDVQFAMASRAPLRLTTSSFDEKLHLAWGRHAAQTDRDWAHRALWLLAQTINYCYDPNNPIQTGPIDGESLKREIREWETQRPDTFRPLHFSVSRNLGRPFPVVWFTSPSHATTVQYICMAKALIQECTLRAIQITSDGSQDAKMTEDELLANLRILFGIALSTEDDPPVSLMACHALRACGPWIRDPPAQTCLLDLLRRTEAETGWSWSFLAQELSRTWHITTG
ncbi:hypothetical protein BDV25DRAFT_168683 [Aspergillus avenaceus]|uniref:Zn(2)-C6 fungal-type domain-containing protein n=1 Tax=Aspergillus avenaceus TaxID=36643 RepID=A0A5N6TP62_ASPAV|nr:hypothetical protein BDV25DRAFT_168683 [Aspergillus avenaceus]